MPPKPSRPAAGRTRMARTKGRMVMLALSPEQAEPEKTRASADGSRNGRPPAGLLRHETETDPHRRPRARGAAGPGGLRRSGEGAGRGARRHLGVLADDREPRAA